jgi:hypothetical protein
VPQPSAIPYARAWKIALRTVHLMAVSVVVGGYLFGASTGQLRFPWAVSVATGVGLALMEAYPSLRFLFEGWWLLVVAKLALLGFLRVAQAHRAAILLAVIALAAVGSHMPARFRHYSLRYGRDIEN